jgi:hypothetical protein
MDGANIVLYVSYAYETNLDLDFLVSYGKNYKYKIEGDENKINNAQVSLMLIYIIAKASNYSIRELISLSQGGSPQLLEKIIKKDNLDHAKLDAAIVEFKNKISLNSCRM